MGFHQLHRVRVVAERREPDLRVMIVSEADRGRRTYAASPASGRHARTFVGEFFIGAGAEFDVVADLQLIVSELVANAIEHGDGREVEVATDGSDPRWWQLAVTSQTSSKRLPEPSPTSWSIAAASDRSGRGLGIVRQMADDVVVEWSTIGLTITCRRRRGGWLDVADPRCS